VLPVTAQPTGCGRACRHPGKQGPGFEECPDRRRGGGRRSGPCSSNGRSPSSALRRMLKRVSMRAARLSFKPNRYGWWTPRHSPTPSPTSIAETIIGDRGVPSHQVVLRMTRKVHSESRCHSQPAGATRRSSRQRRHKHGEVLESVNSDSAMRTSALSPMTAHELRTPLTAPHGPGSLRK